MYGLNIIAADFEFNYLIRIHLALLNESVACDDDEEFPFAVMPVLTFRDAGLADVDAHLTAADGKLCTFLRLFAGRRTESGQYLSGAFFDHRSV